MLGTTLGYLNGLTLGIYDGSDIESPECSTDGTADGKFVGLLLRIRPVSVFEIEFGIVLGKTLGVLDRLILGTYVGI